MNEVEIFGFPGSTYVRTVQMVCEEKGVDSILVPFEYGSEAHYNLHPFGKMPSAKVGDVTLFESLAISTYIDDVFSGTRLQPSDPKDHALMMQWISSFIDYAYDSLVRSIAGKENIDEDDSKKAFDTFKKIDQGMNGGGYLVGKELTLADLYLAPMVSFAQTTINELEDMTNSLQSIPKWQKGMFTRDSFRNTTVS